MLNFFSWLPAEELAGTAGRVLQHVGFEVRGLEAFCAELEAKGIERKYLDRVHAPIGLNIGAASISDTLFGAVI